jgi:hypothetical protein
MQIYRKGGYKPKASRNIKLFSDMKKSDPKVNLVYKITS